MTPRIGILTPPKAAFARWLEDWRAQVYADTNAIAEWQARDPYANAVKWAPGRMVDAVEDMFSTYQREDNSGKAGRSAFLPVVFIAVAQEYTQSPSEAGRPLLDKLAIGFAADTLRRSFRIRSLSLDLRAQVVVLSPDVGSTMSLIAQLAQWADARRTFHSAYTFAGFTSDWPVQVIPSDRMALSTPLGEHVSAMALDLTLRVTVPQFYGPRSGEATDGNDPPGFPVVADVAIAAGDVMNRPSWVGDAEWLAYLRSLANHSIKSDVVLMPLREAHAS